MKKKNIITTLALTMAIGMGATAYAASDNSTVESGQGLGLKRITSMSGFDYISNILKSELGLNDDDITNAINSGKTLSDLATENGMTQEQLKTSLIEDKTEAIDKAVSEDKITAEEGETLKENINTNMQNCSGNFGQRKGMMGQGRLGNGQGRDCFSETNN